MSLVGLTSVIDYDSCSHDAEILVAVVLKIDHQAGSLEFNFCVVLGLLGQCTVWRRSRCLGWVGWGTSSSKVLIFIRSCVAVLARALRGV